MEQIERRKLIKSNTAIDVSFSFPKSSRFRSSNKEKSCGFYSIPTAFDKRSCSFGSGKRSDLVIDTCSPPPDRYNPRSAQTPSITISRSGLGERLILFPKQSPGPGEYSIAPLESGPKYTMFQKYKKKKADDSPCAANYNPNFKILQNNTYSSIGFGFGKKSGKITLSDAPGPGSYTLPSLFPKLTYNSPHSFTRNTCQPSNKRKPLKQE